MALNIDTSRTFEVTFKRKVFDTSTALIKSVPISATEEVTASSEQAQTLFVELHVFKSKEVIVHKGCTELAPQIGKGKFRKSKPKIKLTSAIETVKLEHVWTFAPPETGENGSNADGNVTGSSNSIRVLGTEVEKPERTRWLRKFRDGYDQGFAAALSDGTRLRWEAIPKEVQDIRKDDAIMRCLRTAADGAAIDVVGETFRKNEKMRFAADLDVTEGTGLFAMLGFLTFYERARVVNRQKAQEGIDMSFSFAISAAIDAGGGGGGGGGD